MLDSHPDRGRVRAALVGSGFDVVMAGSLDEVSEILRGRYEADLLVLGTHGHTGIKHALLGSVAINRRSVIAN